MADSKRVNRWLESSETQELLRKLARTIYSDLRRKRIAPPFLDSPDTYPEDVFSVLKSELALFIIEDCSRIQAMVLAADQNLPRYLHHAFVNRCKDLVRSSGLDPLRYYRKRAGEVFRQSASIHTALTGRFLVFSLHPENETMALPSDTELCSIPLPERLSQGLDYTSACRKENLVDLALHFWEKASEVLNGRLIWVDLRDFVTWVACYVPMSAPAMADEQDADHPAGPVSQKPGTRAPAPQLSEIQPLPKSGIEQIQKLAAAFAARLDAKSKAVFYFRFFEDASWEEIARRTGFSSPSGPSYRHAGVLDQLKSFLREWPGLSPEDEDPETIDLFLEAMRSILKESLPES